MMVVVGVVREEGDEVRWWAGHNTKECDCEALRAEGG